MKRSEGRILTTHTGSLPRPPDLVALLNKKELGEPYDRGAFDARIARAIAEVVQAQADTGIDVIGDGEHSQGQLDGLCAGAAVRAGGDRRAGELPRRHARLHRVRRRLRGHEGDAGGALGRHRRQAHGAAEGAGVLRPDQICRA